MMRRKPRTIAVLLTRVPGTEVKPKTEVSSRGNGGDGTVHQQPVTRLLGWGNRGILEEPDGGPHPRTRGQRRMPGDPLPQFDGGCRQRRCAQHLPHRCLLHHELVGLSLAQVPAKALVGLQKGVRERVVDPRGQLWSRRTVGLPPVRGAAYPLVGCLHQADGLDHLGHSAESGRCDIERCPAQTAEGIIPDTGCGRPPRPPPPDGRLGSAMPGCRRRKRSHRR